jgi:hypothetical protein
MDEQQQDEVAWFSLLPDELVVAVILALGDDPHSLVLWARTCKRHAAIARDPVIWRSMCNARFPTPLHERFADFGKDHRWVYRAHRFCARQDDSGPSARVIRPQSEWVHHADNRRWFYSGDFHGHCASGYGVGLVDNAAEPIASIKQALERASNNNGKYEGMWHDGMPHGFGLRVYSRGDCYTGAWVRGQKCGRGVMVWSSGSIYDGKWKDDKRHGRGTLAVPGIWRYEGEWKEDKIHGHGTSVEEDGRTYNGEWVNGKRHGHGVFTAPGSFACGDRHQDTARCEHQACAAEAQFVHDGEWKDGEIHGPGIRTDFDGAVYDGEWTVDTFDGHATVVEVDGKRYEGGWTMRHGPGNSKSYGRGLCTYSDGSVVDGIWDGMRCLSCIVITHAPRDVKPDRCMVEPCMACRALRQDVPAPATE